MRAVAVIFERLAVGGVGGEVAEAGRVLLDGEELFGWTLAEGKAVVLVLTRNGDGFAGTGKCWVRREST